MTIVEIIEISSIYNKQAEGSSQDHKFFRKSKVRTRKRRLISETIAKRRSKWLDQLNGSGGMRGFSRSYIGSYFLKMIQPTCQYLYHSTKS